MLGKRKSFGQFVRFIYNSCPENRTFQVASTRVKIAAKTE